MNPLISVIVPIYNSEKYLEKCINSILNQTYNKLEILLIDDGSIDSSPIICKNIAQKDNRIKFISKHNTGVSDTRNLGIKKASGDFISFVDSDDYLYSNMYETLIQQILKSKSDVIVMDYNIFDGKKQTVSKIINPNKLNNNLDDLFLKTKYSLEGNGFGYIWNKFYRKSVIENIKFPENVNYAEDLIFNLEVLKKTNKWFYLSEKFYNYRTNLSSSLSNSKSRELCYIILQYFYNTSKDYYENPIFISNFSNLFAWQICELLNDTTISIDNVDHIKSIRNKFLSNNKYYSLKIIISNLSSIKLKIIVFLFLNENIIFNNLLLFLVRIKRR